MKIGIILNTNDAETCWNCFRFGNEALKNNHSVKIFLLGKGVESETGSEKYNVKEQIAQFVSKGGKIYACGTCMKSRQMDSRDTCPLSSMKDLYQIVKESDKVLTFG